MAHKNVIITGASGGIGSALAGAFAKKGYGVALCCNKNQQAAQKDAEEINFNGGSAEVFVGDVSDEKQVGEMFAAAQARFGFFDVLINNAGVDHKGLLSDMTLDDWNRVFAVNCTGTFLCCRAVIPSMVSRKSGCIINISSIWGQVGASCEAAYSASKAAIIGLTKALAKELGPSNIRVNCISPGVIDTPMNGDLTPADIAALKDETPLGRIGSPDDVASAAVFLAENEFITGQDLGINGGFVI